jgi:hypothetical protein
MGMGESRDGKLQAPAPKECCTVESLNCRAIMFGTIIRRRSSIDRLTSSICSIAVPIPMQRFGGVAVYAWTNGNVTESFPGKNSIDVVNQL